MKDLVARWLAGRLTQEGLSPSCSLVRHKRRLLEQALGWQAEQRGDDHEFRLRELAPRWLADCGGDASHEALAAEVIAHELLLESRATLPTPGIADTLGQVARWFSRIVFVTDNYLDIEDIWQLLRQHGLDGYFAAGYCSSQVLRTKRSGRLFEHVLRAERLAAAEFLFVGDNPHSDVDAARRSGIEAIHVHDPDEQKRRTRLSVLTRLSAKNRFWRGQSACETIERLPTRLRQSSSAEYNLGLLLAPAFIGFTRYVIEQARTRRLRRLLFLSREGLTFMRMYRRMVRHAGLRSELPPATYLGVSRAATFLPALNELSIEQLHRLLRQYREQSLNRLLRNLSLPAGEFVPLAARHGLTDPDEPISDLEQDERFRSFIADLEVHRRFRVHRDRARAHLCAYLGDQGFFDGGPMGLVDIGWKGTIQDNLIRAVRHRPDCPDLYGLYFGLVHIAEDDMPNAHKYGYLADTRRGDFIEETIFRNGPVFEMFASAAHGGVVGYGTGRGRPERIRPILRSEDVEKRNFHKYAASVFEGINDYFHDYLAVAPLIAATAEEWRPYLIDQLRRYILYPTAAEARSFLKYSHVESFGVFHQTTYEFRGSWRQILFGGSPLRIPQRLIQTLERQFWPEGYLRRLRLPLANVVYDLLETRYGCRRMEF